MIKLPAEIRKLVEMYNAMMAGMYDADEIVLQDKLEEACEKYGVTIDDVMEAV